jgi:hypothetical protein
MYLGDICCAQCLGALLNLVEAHIPGIGIALPTAEGAELAVEETYIRRLEVYVAVVVDLLATHLAFALGSQLTQQPEGCFVPQHEGLVGGETFATA